MSGAYSHPDDPRRALDRIVAMHRKLAAGEALGKQALAETSGVTLKTVQRDLAALRELGAPIAYDRHRRGHVYTRPGWAFHTESLSDHHQFALMVAESALEQYEGTHLHAGLTAAFERIGARLPEAVRERHRLVSDAIHFGGLPAPRIDPAVWDALLMAIQAREVTRIDYAKLGDETTTREVHPYQLVVRDRDWFLIAYQPKRRVRRMYYLPRIRAARLMNAPFEVPADFDPAAFHRQGFNAMQGPKQPVAVELRFEPDVATLAAERPWSPDQQLAEHRDGSVSVRFKSAALFEIRRQVLRYEGRVRVVKPASLRKAVAEVARAIAERHER